MKFLSCGKCFCW